jgi:xanthine dehydrogenase FAD-binding subunit
MPEFDLLVARDRPHLLALLAENPDARMVAGATDFIPLVGAGKWKPRLAIDISHVAELHDSSISNGWFNLGPLTTHAEAEASPLVRERALALAEACASVADPLIRCRATLGGNLCTASPAADSVPALLALGAEICLVSLGGERRMPLESFLIGPGKTAILPGEVLAQICLPIRPGPGGGSAFVKLGRRHAMAISVVNVAAFIQVEAGRITTVRLALGSVAPTVIRSRSTETILLGRSLVELHSAEDGSGTWPRMVRKDISPIDDVRASGAYRRYVAAALTQRVIEQAFERAARIR